MPPVEYVADYLDLVAAIEETAAYLNMPVMLEGYLPPFDPRIRVLKVTPDPGVIEVNVHPAESWDELVRNTEAIYALARETRLGTEKFMMDGQHSGTGGGQPHRHRRRHSGGQRLFAPPRSCCEAWSVTGTTILRSPTCSRACSSGPPASIRAWMRRAPIPSTSWKLPSIRFRIKALQDVMPWQADRVFRHLLTDLSGNTHRAEFCIDKLVFARLFRIAAGSGGTARLRDAAARAHEPHATTSGAGADRVLLANAVPPETRVVGNHAARSLYAAALRRARLGRRDRRSARGRLRISERIGSRRTSSFDFL